MRENLKIFLLVLGAIVFFILGGLLWPKQKSIKQILPTPKVEGIQTSPEAIPTEISIEVKVTRVIDGDTIVLEDGQVVRYIGIDTPEVSQGTECFAKESTNKNKELVEGKMIRMEKDISETDRYKRLLRYVWVGDLFVNDYLVRQGFAKAYTYPPDVKYSKQFVESEKYARGNNLGLWGKCVDATPSSSRPGLETVGNGQWECSRNAYNCSDFKTQKEHNTFLIFVGEQRTMFTNSIGTVTAASAKVCLSTLN